ncbi:Peptidoglycan synthase FtsI [Tsuneonella dongtanensis]|uniref:Peptidoglycan synthase FtsI n=1 Tax=Tsuneonella dongtanensis TaxID=692370 RepID=A0A1B2ACZ0_9SPHN|nr:penicillin-binding protein 2 [Tsuneonella dongtanensis]ANY20013.1 Peptidoglycan synthase FtsI [Tsuneonella dongtanensis]
MNALTYTAAIHSGRVQLVNLRQKSLSVARLRVLFVAVAFAALAVAAVLRIGYLGLTGSARATTSFEEALLPPRGEITDRNGEPLARAFPAFALWYNPEALGADNPLVKSPQQVAKELAAIFPDIDETQLADRLAKGKAGYLRRRVLPEEANKVQAIGELALELPQETDRHYPQGSMGAHVLGYVGADGHGRVGMEAVLDKQLLDPATRGQSTPLSIDVRVQGALEDELTRGMRATNAIGSAGIILDVDTGEVLALASLPEFDPNHIDQAGVANMFNRVTNQVYELGSTFKPLTVAAAIDAGTITDFGRRYSARPFPIGGFTIKDSHPLGDSLNTPEMLIHSSNVVTAHMVEELGANRLKKTMADLGMNARPEIELPARGFPLWASGDWPLLRGMTVGYGHGIAVTPLHLASAYATMVNGGIYRPATMHKVAPGKAAKGRRVFKASTSARMNQLLRMIAVYGTGRNANAPGFRVGGKTGSAEKPGAGGYRKTTLVSTFAAAFPMDRPRYVVIVMMDEPKGTIASSFQRTAAYTAAPVVGRLVPRIGPILGVAPDSSRDVDLTDLAPLVPKGKGE